MTGQTPTDLATSPWLTPRDAACYLGIGLGTLRNWTSQRFVPFAKKGGVVRYHRDKLDRWLEKGGCQGRMTQANDRQEGIR